MRYEKIITKGVGREVYFGIYDTKKKCCFSKLFDNHTERDYAIYRLMCEEDFNLPKINRSENDVVDVVSFYNMSNNLYFIRKIERHGKWINDLTCGGKDQLINSKDSWFCRSLGYNQFERYRRKQKGVNHGNM